MCVLTHFSHVPLFTNLWTIAYWVPQSMGFSRQEYWSGLPCPPPGESSNPGIKPKSITSTLATLTVLFNDFPQAPRTW